jgi:hypothetical protein
MLSVVVTSGLIMSCGFNVAVVDICRDREMAIGISRRHLRGSTAFQADESEEKEGNEDTAEASIAD